MCKMLAVQFLAPLDRSTRGLDSDHVLEYSLTKVSIPDSKPISGGGVVIYFSVVVSLEINREVCSLNVRLIAWCVMRVFVRHCRCPLGLPRNVGVPFCDSGVRTRGSRCRIRRLLDGWRIRTRGFPLNVLKYSTRGGR